MERLAHALRLAAKPLQGWRTAEFAYLTAFVGLFLLVGATVNWWALAGLPLLLVSPFVAKYVYDLTHPEPPPRSPDVASNAEGLRDTNSQDFVSWDDVRQVTLTWSRALDDPQLPPHTEDAWLVHRTDRAMTNFVVNDSQRNRTVLLSAFRERLPNYSFDYARFDSEYRFRFRDLQGGSIVVWKRDA